MSKHKFLKKWVDEQWTVGQYKLSDNFNKIENHSCVCMPDKSLIAVTGPADDLESQMLSDLLSAAPELLSNLKDTYACLCNAVDDLNLNHREGLSALDYENYMKVISSCQALIAKADGRK